MIAPRTLTQLITADPVRPLKDAIVERLKTALPDVKIVAHPGKVDIAEIVGKSVVAAPGVAVGWSRIKPVRRIDDAFDLIIDWTAYVVVEDKVLADRRVDRETIGFAVGGQLLAILADPDDQRWGLTGVLPPEGVDFKPFFTVRDAAQGVAYYLASWTQTLVDVGGGAWAQLPAPIAVDEAGLTFADDDELTAALAGIGLDLEGDE